MVSLLFVRSLQNTLVGRQPLKASLAHQGNKLGGDRSFRRPETDNRSLQDLLGPGLAQTQLSKGVLGKGMVHRTSRVVRQAARSVLAVDEQWQDRVAEGRGAQLLGQTSIERQNRPPKRYTGLEHAAPIRDVKAPLFGLELG